MKTLIVPTDFSPAAINAANYALDMALEINAEVLLLHVYQIPVAITDTPLPLIDIDELKLIANERLDKHRKELEHIASRNIKITTQSALGNMSDELDQVSKKIQPFGVVMGTTGHSAIDRTLFGSNTLSAIKLLTCPVICVPMGKEYGTGIKKIGLACDFREVAETIPAISIKNFIKEFKGELHILNVDHDQYGENKVTQQQVSFLQASLQECNPQFHFIQHKDIEEGINEFAENNNLDLIITIPKKHKLLDHLFRKSSTKQLVFGSHIPVMCIHEEF